MKAFVVSKYNDPLQLADVAEPTVGERDVLVQLQAAGLNQLDEKIRAGEFKQILPYSLPVILGNDVGGTVVRVGAKVRGFRVGDEVYARRASGEQLRQIAALIDSGALRPVLGKVLPFDQVPQAMGALEKGGIRGKAVVSNRDRHHTTRV